MPCQSISLTSQGDLSEYSEHYTRAVSSFLRTSEEIFHDKLAIRGSSLPYSSSAFLKRFWQ